jgi:hypothetical protein
MSRSTIRLGWRSCAGAENAYPDDLLSVSRRNRMGDENKLIGTWKLKSFVRDVVATGERFYPFGEHPDGYLSYSPDGRMYAILAADNRIKPHDVAPTDNERIKLHETMSAYAGTYT